MLSPTQGVYHFGDFQLNLDLRVLVRQGQRVPLGAKAYGILTCLAQHAGASVSKADLLKEVWDGAYAEEATLTQHIFSLRKALGDSGSLIVTVPGHGYRLDAPVHHTPSPVLYNNHLLETVRETTYVVIEESLPAPATKPHSRLYPSIAAVLLVAAAGVGAWFWTHRLAPRDHVGVVLASFSNTTGDATFDSTLQSAIAIDLSQSPYLDLLGPQETVSTLNNMGMKPNTPLTSSVARELCVRTNRQALLLGSIATVSDEYLLTLEALDCNTGKKVAAAKAEAHTRIQVLHALDTLADGIRSKLGESAKSLASYDVPLEQAATTSLEALKAYTVAKQVQAQGNGDAAALPLFQRAIQLDPQFAQAYGEIATTYYNLSEPNLAVEAMKKAYDLRDRVDAASRLTFEAHYIDDVLGDMPAAARIYEVWSATYPHDWVPWLDAANLRQQLGQYDRAITLGRQSLAVKRNAIGYMVLVRACKSSQRFAEARSLAHQAALAGLDSGTLHSLLLEMAADENDQQAVASEGHAMEAYKGVYREYFLAKAASMQGHIAEAERLFRAEIATEMQEGLAESAESVAVEQAGVERVTGLITQARATLAPLGKATQQTADYAIQRALLGDTAFAEGYLAAHRAAPHLSTEMEFVDIPQIRAAIAMQRGHPQDALALLTAPSPYGTDTIAILALRGEAALQANQPAAAIAAYKEIVSNPGRGFGIDHSLAHLWLARAYAKSSDSAAARTEYNAFFALWKDATADLPVLKAARTELAQLK